MPEKLIDIVGREGVDHLEAYFAPAAFTGLALFASFGTRCR